MTITATETNREETHRAEKAQQRKRIDMIGIEQDRDGKETRRSERQWNGTESLRRDLQWNRNALTDWQRNGKAKIPRRTESGRKEESEV